MKTIVLLFIAALAAFAQDANQPKYFVGGGTGVAPYMLPIGSLFGTFGMRIGDNTYTYTNLHTTSVNATLGQGIMQVLARSGNFTLSAIGDVGGNASPNGLSLAIAGGGILAYDISKWTKIAGTSAFGVVKIQRTGDNALPQFGIGIAKTF